jgi:dTDP-4-amino-4,6-dideoxygalactose transaminase
MNWRIPLSDPDIGAEEIAAVTEVLRSKWLTMGAVTTQFEQAFAEKMNVKHALAVTNCTAALHLANVALGIGPGDEVICPALTFVASANATRYTGADVVFADVCSRDDWSISPEAIEAAITERTKAITVVHYAGFPCHMDRIQTIAQRNGLYVIEDCAHSPFAWYDFPSGLRHATGSIGDIGCFSFFSNKNMTTGEGGMITTNRDDLASSLGLLRSHGMTSLTMDRHKGHAMGYDVVSLGFNYRMDELRSAIGHCQLRKVDSFNAKRRQVFRWYAEDLAHNPRVIVPFRDRDLQTATCHIMPVLISRGATSVRERLKDAGIQTSRHYDLVTRFTAYKEYRDFQSTIDPEQIVTLPLSPQMTREHVSEIVKLVACATTA